MSTQDLAARIFEAAVELATPGERAAYLDAACGPDQQLRAEVEQLLAHDEAAGSFLNNPTRPGLVATVDEPVRERPGTVIGAYKLLEQIGEGGFGVVFLAEQQEPIRRKVALKVLKPGMDSKQVIARFEAERQALALMDHPHIAKVLDAGQAASGRPYFVMDLVKGLPITDSCDQSQRTPRERLELFVSVCQAVQHAHQKGIIHRDIKPSNVLVTLHDGTPLVKVIDFGIAKALGQQLTEKTVFTGFAQMIGTPLYMSPEQAALSNVDVDTRSDIYSLGVLLYELLTGTTPFDKERLKQAGYDELRRIIREEEPPRPSTRISTLGQAASTISTHRKSDPKRLSQLFRGELDWIVMKALEKDRNRRYETASAFAADVQRYLHDEPVLACPPSAWYRFRKFARRNRAGLAVAVLLLFFAVLLGSGVGWAVRDRAVRQGETERAVTTALAQAATLLAEGDKQTDNPERWQATTRLALAALEKAEELQAAGVGSAELAQQVRQVRVAVEAALADSRLLVEVDRIRLEQAAVKEDRYDNARAAPLYAKAFGDYGIDLAAPETAAARVRRSRLREVLLAALEDWSWLTRDNGERQRLEQVLRAAEPEPNAFRARWRAAVRWRNAAALVRQADEPEVQRLPAADLVRLARALKEINEPDATERLLRAAVERYPSDFWLNHNLGRLFFEEKPPRAEEAVRYLTAALALRSDSPGVHINLGLALKAKGDWEGAIRCYRAAFRIDPNYATAHHALGDVLMEKGRLDEAVKEYHKAIRLKPDNARNYNNLGIALQKKGRLDDAIAAYRAAIRLKPNYAVAHYNLGVSLEKKGRLDQAIAAYRKALRTKKDFPLAHFNLGNALKTKGRLDQAIAAYRQALRYKKDFPQAHVNLGNALKTKGRLDQAIAAYRKALRTKKNFPEAHLAHFNLGNALKTKGLLDKAIAAYRDAIRLDPAKPAAHYNLGLALFVKGRPDEAIKEYRKAIRLDPAEPVAHYNLGIALFVKGRPDEAIAEYQKAIDLKRDYVEAHDNLGLALMARGRVDEAIAEHREAIRLKPDYAQARTNLGLALENKGQWDEAIAEHRGAIRLQKDQPKFHYNLGRALYEKRLLDEAIAAYREAIRLKPDYVWAHDNLGLALQRKGRLDEAIAQFRKAILLKKDHANAHFNLGIALANKGQWDEAIAAYRKAIRLGMDFAEVHNNLGGALYKQGNWKGAVAAFRRAIRLKKDYANPHYNLGCALAKKGRLDQAIKEYRKFIRLKPDFAKAHYGLGNALKTKGQVNEAVAAFRRAIALKPDHAEAHCNLGQSLRLLGRFTEALAAVRTGHKLGSKRPGWPYPSAAWVRALEALVTLDAKLSKIRKGESKPGKPAERLQLAWLCQQPYKQLNAAAARFFRDAFAADPKLADDLPTRHRYNAACAAALAGCGQGKDAGNLKEQERARLRRQALDWLQADLAAWRKQLQKNPGKARSIVLQQMQHWQRDADFAGVRGLKALVHLSEAERLQWQKLWADVVALHQDAAKMK
jgi:tetratricopeptide (TPR) repeat protein/serine/threonine protein kinase